MLTEHYEVPGTGPAKDSSLSGRRQGPANTSLEFHGTCTTAGGPGWYSARRRRLYPRSWEQVVGKAHPGSRVELVIREE